MSIGDESDPRAYVRLAADVRKAIAEGKYPPGSPTPSITTLSQQSGHARQTCSKALNVLVDEGLLIRYPGPRLLRGRLAGQAGQPGQRSGHARRALALARSAFAAGQPCGLLTRTWCATVTRTRGTGWMREVQTALGRGRTTTPPSPSRYSRNSSPPGASTCCGRRCCSRAAAPTARTCSRPRSSGCSGAGGRSGATPRGTCGGRSITWPPTAGGATGPGARGCACSATRPRCPTAPTPSTSAIRSSGC